MAMRTLADGEQDEESEGKVLIFNTSDFVTYKELGLYNPTKEYLELIAFWGLWKIYKKKQRK